MTKNITILYFLPRNKLAWAYRQRECGGLGKQNCRCRYGSSNHTLWWTPRGLGARRTRGCLTRHLKTLGGGSQNHLKSYLRVPKTVTKEEAYKGGQKLQTYIFLPRNKSACAYRQRECREPRSKTVGVATVLQTTPYGGPHGALMPEEHEDA